MMKTFLLILIGISLCGIRTSRAQLAEFGLGYAPTLFNGTEISSFDGGDVPTYNSAISVENTLFHMANMMFGLYYHVLHVGMDFSVGAHYQAFTYLGTMDGGYYDAKTFGVDLPVFAEVRVGSLATEASTSSIGAALGVGYMYNAAIMIIDENKVKLGSFMPAISASISGRYAGVQLMFKPGKYQILYETNTGGIPRAEFIKYQLTYYWYLGEI